MNVDCQWIEDNFESFFCDRLAAAEDHRFHAHLENCGDCNRRVTEFRAIEPMIKQVFRHDLAMARIPARRRSPVALGAFATAAVSLVLLGVWLIPKQSSDVLPPRRPIAAVAAPAETPSVPKVNEAEDVTRTKPQPGASDRPAISPPAAIPPVPAQDAPAFVVADSAGYSRNLTDFRGYVLIFGVWSSNQPQTIANLQHIYDAFGKNTKVRILGVTNETGQKPSKGTFPVAYNQGSRLLGATLSEFLVVDGAGNIRHRGSLLDSQANLLTTIRTSLDKLGLN